MNIKYKINALFKKVVYLHHFFIIAVSLISVILDTKEMFENCAYIDYYVISMKGQDKRIDNILTQQQK